MTREEAIKRFENVKANALVQKASGVSEYWQNEIDGTIEAIDMAIEALQQTAWIPVEERLPDIDQSVLICTKYGEITDGYRWNEKDWFCAWGEYNGAHVGGEYDLIVAWMPLPEPYKGGR